MKENPERQRFMREPLPHEHDQQTSDKIIASVLHVFACGGVIVERGQITIAYGRDLGYTMIEWKGRRE